MIKMMEVRYTRNLFLRGMCIIYLFAFISLYVQIPGLYGDNGILPARTQINLKGKATLFQKMTQKPTFLWLANYVGLNVEYMLDVVALSGALLSFFGFISQKFCIAPVFLTLWALYYSVFQVGQVFMQNQWDNLLLEAGFLCVLIAPLLITAKGKISKPSDGLTFWGIRWLLFRFMFASGAVKLASGCPVWWNLDALSHLFETQCLPGPLAWYAHHLPSWFLRFITATIFLHELVIPFLFFFPNRKVRIVTFFIQLYLFVNLIATGNWNYRDFLVICMSIALLDDQFFYKKKSKNGTSFTSVLSTLSCLVVFGAIAYSFVVLFKIRITDNLTITSEIAFTKEQYEYYLVHVLPVSVCVGVISLAFTIAGAVAHSIVTTKGSTNKIITTITTIIYTAAIASLFALSIVPFASLHESHNATVPEMIRHLHTKVNKYHISNNYNGMFSRVSGVNGRPEIIIEGSNSLEGPWKPYEFLYKPGNVNNSLPLVAPHSPRLDWQMWFAAQSTYQKNPWIMSLTYRLLNGQKEVLGLLNNVQKPFGDKAPKYIRGILYHYHFSPWRKTWNDQSWWTKEKVGEYFPIYSRDHPPLMDQLKGMKILGSDTPVRVTNESLKMILDLIRSLVIKIESSLLLWSIFTAGCAIIMSSHSGNTPSKYKKK